MRVGDAISSWGIFLFRHDCMADIDSRHFRSQRGIVHGKLKPTNILISENGQACISDYGMVELKPSSGCARYFSPEAWKGVCIPLIRFLYLLICVFLDNFTAF